MEWKLRRTLPALVALGGISLMLLPAGMSAQGRQRARSAPPATGLTLFADVNFGGQVMNVRTDTPDLQPINFNDAVSSIQIAPGELWEVCEHTSYQGRCAVVVGPVVDLRNGNWNDVISSARRVEQIGDANLPRVGATQPSPQPTGEWTAVDPNRPHLLLYANRGFQGQSYRVDGDRPALGAGRAGSVQVTGGAWLLCEGQSYAGRCVVTSEHVPDLAAAGLRNGVGSARPVEAAR